MPLFAFLGDPRGFSDWYLVKAHLPTTAIQDLQHVVVVGLAAGLIVRPLLLKVQREIRSWQEHRHQLDVRNQKIEASNTHIANLLDTSKPGGLSDVVAAITTESAARPPDIFERLEARAVDVDIRLVDGTQDVVERRVVYWADVEELLERRRDG